MLIIKFDDNQDQIISEMCAPEIREAVLDNPEQPIEILAPVIYSELIAAIIKLIPTNADILAIHAQIMNKRAQGVA